ncbi:MAG: YvcK family protein [Syntrophomonadaceae bacterium]|jgi:uncharacterized cofD-like protein|nr:YvcK family protein [Syntrophomonadaceae bacterium]
MTERVDEPKIVVIGGGTGLSVLLKGLKKLTSQLTAVVTVTDDGGSSGRLRSELGVLPPGDIRSCLVALAETETLMDKVFQHRFWQGESIKGHNLGNLLLVAMTEITGDFVSAIKEVSKVLKVRGQVIPVTLEPVNLTALMADGIMVYGETSIRNYPDKIYRLGLTPETCLPVPAALEAIREADAVIIGPGSLYTSIVPNLLVEGVVSAIAESKAPVIFISNIMTEQGETDNFTAEDHLRNLLYYVDQEVIDYVIVNTGYIDEIRLNRYKQEKAIPVRPSSAEIRAMGYNVIEEDLVSNDDVAWHDSDKLARVIFKIIDR